MALLLLISAAGLGAAAYMYGSNLESYEEAVEKAEQPTRPVGYNPYILNQFQTMADTIYSPGLDENKIHQKPDRETYGVYGISEHHIKMDRCEPFTIVSQKVNLNR